ncbi:hypothetical protein ACFC1R_23430 [Kitasatospora sp. NPDC056138]
MTSTIDSRAANRYGDRPDVITRTAKVIRTAPAMPAQTHDQTPEGQ